MPKIVHYDSNEGKEVIFLEDVREKGFVLTNRLNTLDKKHVELVIKEYGRIHAASRLLFDKYGKETLEKFKLDEHPLSHKVPVDIIRAGIRSSIETGMKVCEHRSVNLDAKDLAIAVERLNNIVENIKRVVNFVHDDTSPF